MGTRGNGRWQISPANPSPQITRRYRDGTLILETTFETEQGAATLIDFMPLFDGASDLVRLVVGQRGRIDFRLDLVIRFDYGVTIPWVDQLEEGGLQAVAGPDLLVLRTAVPLQGDDFRTVGEFSVAAGETVSFVLTHGPSHRRRPDTLDPQLALAQTEASWRDWSARCPPVGAWSEAVKRSLLTLKALTYGPTGGIVAAPTTSLPERIGGPRNWDYRYCWLRDAAFTLLALMNLGYYDEARAWRDWLLRAVAGSPAQLQIMYGVAGEKQLPERELFWLAGYEESRVPFASATPQSSSISSTSTVRLFMQCLQAIEGGMAPSRRGVAMRRVALDYIETIWREPDEGIWEVRGGRRHFTHSKLMAWVAFDRAAITAGRTGDLSASERWRRIADDIHREVCQNGFAPELGSFVQSYGVRRLDASLLQIPLVRFLPASDPRVLGTVAAIEQRLMCDGLVMRYDTDDGVDGLPPGEGAFLACSFWLADNYILQRRFGDAQALFERLLALQNDLGLLAEEYDPRAGRMLGNFPQAFSHVGLINTAVKLAQAEGSAGAHF